MATTKKFGLLRILAFYAISLFVVLSCDDNKATTTSDNPSQFLTDSAKIAMVHSLKTIDGDRFLEMDYTVDYDLDKMLESGISTFGELNEYIATNLLDIVPGQNVAAAPEAGCSAFAATDPVTSDKYFGRNYDFCHVEDSTEVPVTAIMVRTAPKNGKKSINMIDSYWIGYKKGFYNDGKSDLSMLVGAPYSVLDGMNEDGFAMGILHLGGNPTAQNEPDKKAIWGNVLIRVLLDKASTVDEAIEMAKSFNMNMVNPALGNNHFFMADATGNYAILEYSYEANDPLNENSIPNRTCVFDGPDFSYVTNFYVDPTPNVAANDVFGGESNKGKARYLILKGTLQLRAYKLSKEQVRDLLKAVSQDTKPEENTSHTQWSATYNLTKKTMDISILQEFEKNYSFQIL